MRPPTYPRATRTSIFAGALITIVLSTILLAPRVAGAYEPRGGAAAGTARVADVVYGPRRIDIVRGRHAVVAGRVPGAVAGQRVVLQRDGRRWRTIARTTTSRSGRFRLVYLAGEAQSAPLRIRSRGAVARVGLLNVYRRALVSWYGPGLYGNGLSCGGRLTPGTIGVAHKSLPCGTRLTLRHGSRSVRVKVIDRGPYVGAREFDLTAATRARLRFEGVGAVEVTV